MSDDTTNRLDAFVSYARSLAGYERGEAQVFCDRLFQAFGHGGYKEAGAKLEFQVRKPRGRGTKFADLLWRPRLLIEMKSRGEALQKHYRQAFEYWLNLVPDRPRFVVLCNFDEFWIYDFNTQMDSPVDRVALDELPVRYTALNFLFPDERKPLFGNDKVQVTREAADNLAQVFNSLIARGEDRGRAQRLILQSVVAMFAEDFDLLPRDFFSLLLNDCVEGASTYDLLGGLFRQMAERNPARGGRFKDVRYFNGGLFELVQPLELEKAECQLLLDASSQRWTRVAPPIFGTLFQQSMEASRRHALGAHFTSEADIQKVVLPTIVIPWQERIDRASTLAELRAIAKDLLSFRVLDPACGSGNFLYIAYRELVNLEMEVLRKIHENFGERAQKAIGQSTLVSTTQFFGLDVDPFAVELAKVTLMLGKRIAVAETRDSQFAEQKGLPLEFENPLPLDNLDANLLVADALFAPWPASDAIIGNPPYQSKNKMVEAYGREYVDRVRERYPDVPGRADYCVYWFRRAHEELRPDGRAGLVGTNTVRQNYSREGGLDYIVANGGTITEAVSSQVWSGDADVHVSIVNWVKGLQAGPKKLFKQIGDDIDSPWEVVELESLSSSLSGRFDVSQAKILRCNEESDTTYQGQTHGHEGFLLSPDEAIELRRDPTSATVIHPYMTGDDLVEASGPRRFAIDLNRYEDTLHAAAHREAFRRVEALVMPDVLAKAAEERRGTGKETGPRQTHARKWWRYWRGRDELLTKLAGLPRYVACARVTKRPIFAFVAARVRPSDVVQVFTFADDYSFGVLQSSVHWEWFTERCSTLTERFRYTSNTVYDSFPWPQAPTLLQARKVAAAAIGVRATRDRLTKEFKLSLRELYRSLERPGDHLLKEAHAALDQAVRDAYGMGKRDTVLEFVFELNRTVFERESSMQPVVGPGLPPSAAKNAAEFITSDCIASDA